jgi:hypothetical protein
MKVARRAFPLVLGGWTTARRRTALVQNVAVQNWGSGKCADLWSRWQ